MHGTESAIHIKDHFDVVGTQVGERRQKSNGVFLAATDLAGNQPEEIDSDASTQGASHAVASS